LIIATLWRSFSENTKHLARIEAAANVGKHIICEKPVVVRQADFDKVREVVSKNNVKFMTAFPCRFSPAYQNLKQRIKSGELGEIKAINATNRGQCPGMWFIQPELSGGGAMIDHVVTLPTSCAICWERNGGNVEGQIGSNMYGGKDWDDTGWSPSTTDLESLPPSTAHAAVPNPSELGRCDDEGCRHQRRPQCKSFRPIDWALQKRPRKVLHGSRIWRWCLTVAMMGAFVPALPRPDHQNPVTLEDGLAAAYSFR